jgi:2-polyprenyl-6-methoxyphenol hydroxylase-like FAD-dependent oxidoreductase
MSDRTALIVGAGIGGLAAAIALGRAGWRVRIFERAAEIRPLGFGLSLAPNAVAALRELGIADRVLAEAHVVERVEIRTSGGKVLKRFRVDAASDDAIAVFALRPALHRALLDGIPPGAISLSSQAAGVESKASAVTVTLADGRSATGDVLVGADGIGSTIRKLLHDGEGPPPRSGYFAIRGVAHNAADCLAGLSAVAYLDRGIEAATVRAGRDSVYWYVSLLPEDAAPMIGPPEDMLQRCAGLLDDGFRQVVQATRPEDARLDELFDRKPIANWGAGRVTVLGDAAHPMLPHTGQGAAQALEDAVALGLVLAADGDPAFALRRYEQVRASRTRAIVRRGPRIAGVTTTRSVFINALRGVAIRLMPARAAAAGFLLARGHDPHRALR